MKIYTSNLDTQIITKQDNEPVGAIKTITGFAEEGFDGKRIVFDKISFNTDKPFDVLVYLSSKLVEQYKDCRLEITTGIEADDYLIVNKSKILY